MPRPNLPEALRIGRRALEGMENVEMLEDFVWNDELQRWILKIRITLDDESEFVPSVTDWYALVESSYPWGYIRIYPATEAGIVNTFPHQQYNSEGKPGIPFRMGFLCLDTATFAIGRQAIDQQPYEDHSRLKWYVDGTIEWLRDAQNDQLLRPGDHYELPQFPGANETRLVVGFNEDSSTHHDWQGKKVKFGRLILNQLGGDPDVYVTHSFQDVNGTQVFKPQWGSYVNFVENHTTGIWLRLPGPPIFRPWQAPLTWDELNIVCEEQGIPFYSFIRECAHNIRDGSKHIALIGFPISAKVGEEPTQMHWQALQLPVLSWKKTAKGFRTTPEGYLERDQIYVFSDSTKPQWLHTQNWNHEEISRRGRLLDVVTSKKVLVIGAGALGSTICELLVRGGVQNLTVMEHDSLDMGNLVRHTLTMADVKRPKGVALAERLCMLSPNVNVEVIASAFPPTDSDDIEEVQSADVVIDTTAQDSILHHLEAFPWNGEKKFYSFSFGMGARKLYCYSAHGETFPMADYRNQINPYIAQDKQEFDDSGEEMPMEGTGCWHRLFPARIDDVWMMAPITVKFMEETLSADSPVNPLLRVYKQDNDDGFQGISEITPQET